MGIQISHEWNYHYILADKCAGCDLNMYLHCQKKRRKLYGCYDHRGKIPNRVSIDDIKLTSFRGKELSEIVDQRQRIGDWETDTLIGKGHRQAIMTLIERKSRFAFMVKVDQRKAEQVGDTVIGLLLPFPKKFTPSWERTQRDLMNMNAATKNWGSTFTLLILIPPGKDVSMRI